MRHITTHIRLLKVLEYRSIVRRKWSWIIVSAILTPFLAFMMMPGLGGSGSILPNSQTTRANPLQPSVSQAENLQPNPLLFISVAFVVGLIIGVVVAVLPELTSGSVRSELELTRLTKIPVLTSIPLLQDKTSAPPEDHQRE